METVRTAVELPESTGKIALQGYCLGALMAFITAARYEVDAAVAYHGADTEKYLGEVGRLAAPLLMHLGEEDEFISKAAQAQIKAALAGKANATVYSYPGQRHAFSRHNGLHYNAAAAALANRRTSEFLHQQLRWLLPRFSDSNSDLAIDFAGRRIRFPIQESDDSRSAERAVQGRTECADCCVEG
jgi:carboxymethylenebutenolidase